LRVWLSGRVACRTPGSTTPGFAEDKLPSIRPSAIPGYGKRSRRVVAGTDEHPAWRVKVLRHRTERTEGDKGVDRFPARPILAPCLGTAGLAFGEPPRAPRQSQQPASNTTGSARRLKSHFRRSTVRSIYFSLFFYFPAMLPCSRCSFTPHLASAHVIAGAGAGSPGACQSRDRAAKSWG
jgi:hypothetical protein